MLAILANYAIIGIVFCLRHIFVSKRQHIHVICVLDDPSIWQMHDQFALYFERARLSFDLFDSAKNSYSWRMIHACDFVALIVGKQYGTRNPAGVSQMHISYLNAKTKHKPLLVLACEGQREGAATDFLALLAQDGVPIWYYQDNDNLNTLIDDAYLSLTLDRPTSEGVDDLAWIERQAGQNENFTKIISDIVDVIPMTDAKHDNTGAKTMFALQHYFDPVIIKATAQAFSGGTLTDTDFVFTTDFSSIIDAIKANAQGESFAKPMIARALTQLATIDALANIQEVRPEVHAVGRCVVAFADVDWTEDALATAGVIVKDGELWRFAPEE